jgi:hypothetical protein
MPKDPRVGDQRQIGRCGLCGGTEYEVYEADKGYGDHVSYHWTIKRHEYEDGQKLCITELSRRIAKLEQPVRRGK